MQVNLNDERGAIARIIDPGAMFHPALPTEGLGPLWKARRDVALAKADRILALRTKEPSRG
jgi:hypothetical protein